MKKKLRGERWVKGCKERGEWVELCFMAKAAGMGMLVSKPLVTRAGMTCWSRRADGFCGCR